MSYVLDCAAVEKRNGLLNKKKVPTKTSKLFKKGYTLKNGVSNRKRSDHVIINKWNPGTINTMLKNELADKTKSIEKEAARLNQALNQFNN